jgi:hypothetical protein
MRAQAVAWDLNVSHADLELMLNYINKLGGYGLGLFRVMDLGLQRELFELHLNETIESLKAMAGGDAPRILLRPKGAGNRALVETTNELWNFPQTLRFAAATTFLTQYYKRWMDPQDVRRAITAKVLYKCQTGILDDFVDKGHYSYLEAKQLYHLVFSSMMDTDYDQKGLVQRLVPTMNQDQLDLLDLVVGISSGFNALIRAAPHGGDYAYHMVQFNDRLGLAQALSMYMKEEHYDLEKVKRIAKDFPAPSTDVHWSDKLATGFTVGTQYNLLDMSFAHRRFNIGRSREFFKAWWYFDSVLAQLNTAITIYDDLRDNIVNPSLIAMREDEVMRLHTLKGYDPNLTQDDYDHHLRWLAELASRGLRILSRSLPDPERYFPFMVVMMPFMLMAEVIGKGDQAIRTYLEALVPAVKATLEDYDHRAKAHVRFPLRARAES